MSCLHCRDGRLTQNFYPQLGFDVNAEKRLYGYTVVKSIFDSPDGPMWAEVHVPSGVRGGLLEGAIVESYTRARFCPVCGGKLEREGDDLFPYQS